jgi:hypothetical protein
MIFQIGDILKFSEKGLRTWAGEAGPDDPRRQWRWEVVAVASVSMFLKRIDDLGKDRDWWSPYFFEKAEV